MIPLYVSCLYFTCNLSSPSPLSHLPSCPHLPPLSPIFHLPSPISCLITHVISHHLYTTIFQSKKLFRLLTKLLQTNPTQIINFTILKHDAQMKAPWVCPSLSPCSTPLPTPTPLPSPLSPILLFFFIYIYMAGILVSEWAKELIRVSLADLFIQIQGLPPYPIKNTDLMIN